MAEILTGQQILDEFWLVGTTCRRNSVKKAVMLENSSHVILRHYSHSEWFSYRNNTCEAYAELYRKADFTDDTIKGWRRMYGYGVLKRWEGRLSVSRIIDECKDMGIAFEKPTKEKT